MAQRASRSVAHAVPANPRDRTRRQTQRGHSISPTSSGRKVRRACDDCTKAAASVASLLPNPGEPAAATTDRLAKAMASE